MQQTLSNRLLVELEANVNCSTALLTVQARVKELETQLAAAKPPAETLKPAEPPKQPAG